MLELLIAMMLGMVLLGMLMNAVNILLTNIKLQNALQELQLSASTFAEMLGKEIERAGYIGCAKLSDNFPVFTRTQFNLTAANKIVGDAHKLTIRYQAFPNALLQKQIGAILQANKRVMFALHDVLVISDCAHAEIFTVKHITEQQDAQLIQPASKLKFVYTRGAEIGKLKINQFYLANKSNTLIYQDIQQRKYTLFSHMKKLNFDYLIKRNQQVIRVKAEAIANWSSVIGVIVEYQFENPYYPKSWYLYAAVG